MKQTPRLSVLRIAGLVLLPAMLGAQAQTIERMKLTDGDLSCAQLMDEGKVMDLLAAQAGSGNPALAQQAMARKEHLTGMFLRKKCSVSSLHGSGSSAAKPTVAAAPVPVPVVVPTLPALPATPLPTLKFNVDEVNPEDLLDSNKTLVVPTAYLTVLVAGRVGAVQQAGMFQSGNASARSSVSYGVTGLDKAYLQGLAQRAYDDFVAQLRGAGYKVLTYADVRERDVFRAAARETDFSAGGLPGKTEGGHGYVTATPTDEQHFKMGFGGSKIDAFWRYGKTLITDATLVIPHYTIHAPQVWGETSRGYKSVSAQVNTAPGMNMTVAEAVWMGQPRSRMMRGIPGVRTKQQVINLTETAGTLRETANTTPHAANALSAGLAGFGSGNIQTQSRQMEFVVDRAAYAAGLMNGVAGFNAEVARVAAQAKP
jgi:hypothetical protein